MSRRLDRSYADLHDLDAQMKADQISMATREQALADVTERDALFTQQKYERALERAHRERTGGDADPQVLKLAAREVLTNPELALSGTRPDGSTLYTSREMLDREMNLVADAKAVDKQEPLLGVGEAKGFVDRFEDQTRSAGFAVLADQGIALQKMLSEQGGVHMLEGPPGAGKSAMLKFFVAGHKEATQGEGELYVTALSPKIAADMGNDVKADPSRVQPLEQMLEGLESGAVRPKPGALLVVDEAALLGTGDLGRLMTQVRDNGMRVALIGDDRQIAPVAAGQPFTRLSEELGSAELSSIVRQASPVDQTALLAMRQGGPANLGTVVDWLETPNQNGSPRTGFKNGAEVLNEVAAEAGRFAVENPAKSMVVLTSSELEARRMNQAVVAARREADPPAADQVAQLRTRDAGPLEVAPKDRIIFTQTLDVDPNRPGAEIPAGATASVVGVQNGQMQIQVGKSKDIISLSTERSLPIDHAYAFPLEKAQGVSVDKTFLAVTRPVSSGEALVAFSRSATRGNEQGETPLADITAVVAREVYPDNQALAKAATTITRKDNALDAIQPGVQMGRRLGR